jgi:hypothetical protein
MRFIKVKALASAVGSVVKEQTTEIKSNYNKTVAENMTAAEIAAHEARKAELQQRVKDARAIARDSARELKALLNPPAEVIIVPATEETTMQYVEALEGSACIAGATPSKLSVVRNKVAKKLAS